MNAVTRKKLGAVVLAISWAVGLGLYLLGVPLLSEPEVLSTSSPDGGVMVVGSAKLHWPWAVACLGVLGGVVMFIWPSRKPTRLGT